jgi:hypothetical protein
MPRPRSRAGGVTRPALSRYGRGRQDASVGPCPRRCAAPAREVPGSSGRGRFPRQPLAQHRGHGMKAEDVAHLQDAARLHDEPGQPPALVHGQGEGLLDEAVAARAQALPGQQEMIVGRRHDVHRVHVREGLPEVLDRVVRGHAGLDREGAPLRRDVGRPQLHPQLAEHARCFPGPSPQPSQTSRPSLARRPGPRRPGSAVRSFIQRTNSRSTNARHACCRRRTWTARSAGAGDSPALEHAEPAPTAGMNR